MGYKKNGFREKTPVTIPESGLKTAGHS